MARGAAKKKLKKAQPPAKKGRGKLTQHRPGKVKGKGPLSKKKAFQATITDAQQDNWASLDDRKHSRRGQKKVTPHFRVYEFDCQEIAEVLFPEERAGWADKRQELAEQLEIIRKKCGNKPITITSAYRSPEANKMVGGKARSKHKEGIAVDIKVKGLATWLVYRRIEELMDSGQITKGGLGSYKGHVHYDLRGRKATWGTHYAEVMAQMTGGQV